MSNFRGSVQYLAAERGDLKHAEPILAGVIAMRPNRAAGHIGLAFAAMSAGQGSRAIAVFENLRPPVPSLSALWRRTAAPDDTAADAPDRFAPHERVALDVHHAVMLHAVGRQAEGEQIVSAIQWDNVPAQDADGQPLDPALRRLADVLTNKTTANARSR